MKRNKQKTKNILDLLAHGRGRRDRLPTVVVPDKSKKKREQSKLKDQLTDI